VIEDAAEALGAEYYHKKLGSLGHPTVFAFYANKQITTGEGGMITTNSKKEYRLLKSLVNQGRGSDMQWLKHVKLGYNYRMTEMSAAMGRVQLKKINQLLTGRQQIAKWYKQRLRDIKGINLMLADNQNHKRSWFIYPVRLDSYFDRDEIIKQLGKIGIPAKAYLPSIHLQPYMKQYGFKSGDLPISEAVSSSCLSLPFYAGMEERLVDKICYYLIKIIKSRL